MREEFYGILQNIYDEKKCAKNIFDFLEPWRSVSGIVAAREEGQWHRGAVVQGSLTL